MAILPLICLVYFCRRTRRIDRRGRRVSIYERLESFEFGAFDVDFEDVNESVVVLCHQRGEGVEGRIVGRAVSIDATQSIRLEVGSTF